MGSVAPVVQGAGGAPRKRGWRTCLVVVLGVLVLTCLAGTATCGGCVYCANQQNEQESERLVTELQARVPSHPNAAEYLVTLAALAALLEAGDLTMAANARLAGARGLAMSDGVLSDEEIDDIMGDVEEIVAHGGDVGSSGGSDFDWD